ncbi:FAD-dependent thymidylate synthase [bacterium]|jgi:thymidylate synthase (FAD)|nr:FAD-dependent thymidylate synthase [bacterium]MDA9753773.1 FAD-dependent thymidylate synthase [bacterium]NSW96030.1 FAD-dependent thymidylate synthase [bacterium]GIR28516.1 MAG: FAD-dependent thymidylate synthase [bacterium]|tara:strand:- start:54 stop:719 length:666 start_codon:yes stop_codon:yes gene_type:complete
MKVRLVSYSKPTIEFENEGITDVQELVAFCARVSNPSNQNNNETSQKLIKYLINNKHWSPLEMVTACIEIETTRDIARQILRHRSFSFQEFSQRYADPTKDLSFVLKEARLQDNKNRQNSIDTDNETLKSEWINKQKKLIDLSLKTYKWAIDNGIAKEQARAVLPEGNTVSRMYMNGTLRSWVHYIELRSSNGTQKEHMEIAKSIAKIISDIFPMMSDFSS